jgi:plastocyanin
MFNQIGKSLAVAMLFCSFCLLANLSFSGEEKASAAMPQAASAVTMNNNQYGPAKLTVAVGTTVTWTNKEAKPHTVTADDNSFTSKALKENDAFSFKFDKPGTYAYHCAFHGGNGGKGMAGTVVVTAKK